MGTWILILQLLSPGGDYMGKIGLPMVDQKSCEFALKNTRKPVDTEYPLAPKARGWMCVTRGHWEGHTPMPGVPLD
jgi:hypothetical protein